MPVTRAQMETARAAYDRLADARTTRLVRGASKLELSDALKAIGAPLRTIAAAAGLTDFDDRYRLGVVVLAYPYARHRTDWSFDLGAYARTHAPRAKTAMATLVTTDAPERTAFVKALRRLLIAAHARRDAAAYVDWALLGQDIVTWTPETARRWAQTWRHDAPPPKVPSKPAPTKQQGARPAHKPAARPKAPTPRASSRFLAVGKSWWLVRWLKGHAYGYRRTYVGTSEHAKPRFRDAYLGRLDDTIARTGDDEALSRAMRNAARRRRG